jgi:hypothetical protein
MSLHLHQVPQADMLECKLEILLLVPYPNKILHIWICSPRGVSTTTYWQMTHIWWHLWKDYTTWLLAGGSQRLILHKASFILPFFVKLSVKILVYKGQDNPHTLHTDQVCSSGRNSTKFWSTVTTTPWSVWPWASPDCCYSSFKAFRNGEEILPIIPWLETQLSISRTWLIN